MRKFFGSLVGLGVVALSLLSPSKAQANPFGSVFNLDTLPASNFFLNIGPAITKDILRLTGTGFVNDDIGDLTSEVWLSDNFGTATYIFTVTPKNSVDNPPAGQPDSPVTNFGALAYITQFNTIYSLGAYTPTKIGWSFSTADVAGSGAGGFGTSADVIPFQGAVLGMPDRWRYGIEWDADGTAADTVHLGTGWDTMEPMVFYFQVPFLPLTFPNGDPVFGSYSVEGVSDGILDPFGSAFGYRPGNINTNPIPEPSTYLLCLAGLGLIGLVRSRRSK